VVEGETESARARIPSLTTVAGRLSVACKRGCREEIHLLHEPREPRPELVEDPPGPRGNREPEVLETRLERRVRDLPRVHLVREEGRDVSS
jgi:hypothetical protein